MSNLHITRSDASTLLLGGSLGGLVIPSIFTIVLGIMCGLLAILFFRKIK